MLNLNANYAAPNAELFDQFDDELEESGSRPYLQTINPGGKNGKKLDGDPLAFGLAISTENAEAVGLDLDRLGWAAGEEISIHPLTTATIERGYVGRTCNLVVLSVSEQEVQEKHTKSDGDTFYRFVDLAWRGGKRTDAGEAAQAEKDAKVNSSDRCYRVVKRWLVLLLDSDLQPLHDRPLQYTGKNAFGSSLSQEYQDFQNELGQAYRKAAMVSGRSVKGGRFSRTAQAYTVFPIQIGYHIPKENDRSAFTCITGRYSPVAEASKEGQVVELDRRDRKVKATAVHFGRVMIAHTSPLGQLITQLTAEFADFSKPNRGRADVPSDGSRPWSAQGMADAATAEFHTDGSITVVIDTGTERAPVHIPAHLAGRVELDGASLVIDGIVPEDGGPVRVTRIEAVAADDAPAAPVGQVPAGLAF